MKNKKWKKQEIDPFEEEDWNEKDNNQCWINVKNFFNNLSSISILYIIGMFFMLKGFGNMLNVEDTFGNSDAVYYIFLGFGAIFLLVANISNRMNVDKWIKRFNIITMLLTIIFSIYVFTGTINKPVIYLKLNIEQYYSMIETNNKLIYECNSYKYRDFYVIKNDSMIIENLNLYKIYRLDMFGDTVGGGLGMKGGVVLNDGKSFYNINYLDAQGFPVDSNQRIYVNPTDNDIKSY